MGVAELLSNATGDKKETIYICSKQCYYELNEAGSDVKILDSEPLEGSKVLQAAAIMRTDHSFVALLIDGSDYKLSIWREHGVTPVYEERVSHQPEEAGNEEIELELLCENEKFLGFGTFIMSSDDLFGSSSYYEWDGNKFSHVTGELDDWYEAEKDVEMEISADGQRLERRVLGGM